MCKMSDLEAVYIENLEQDIIKNIAALKKILHFNTEKMSKNFCRQIADNRYLKN